MNRFSNDVSTTDHHLLMSMRSMMMTLFSCLITFALCALPSAYILIFIACLLIFYGAMRVFIVVYLFKLNRLREPGFYENSLMEISL